MERLEVHKLTDELAGSGAVSRWGWRWQLAVEEAPRLFVELLGTPPSFDRLFDLLEPLPPAASSWLQFPAGFGTVDLLFTTREGIVAAVAGELGVPAPPLPPPPPPPPPWRIYDHAEITHTPQLSYDPGYRRDPFAGGTRRPRQETPTRPAGRSGLSIDQIEVTGLFRAPDGALAEIRAGTELFFVGEGDQVWDGDVERIDFQQGVTFKQMVSDWRAPRPFRPVVKTVDPRWIGSPGPRGAGPAAPASGLRVGPTTDDDDPARRRHLAPELWNEVYFYRPAGRRDPFVPPGGNAPADDPAEGRPSALSELTCTHLAFAGADHLSWVLDRAGERLESYLWERWVIEERGRPGGLKMGPWGDGGAGARRVLDDVEQAAASDLADLLAELPRLDPILKVREPPPVEMFALLGDLDLIAGRPAAAAEAYGVAERLSAAYEPLCGRLYDGKLYGVESVVFPGAGGRAGSPLLTGYLLAWDPDSGTVHERHLLPAPPEAFATGGDSLRISLTGAGNVRLRASRLEPPARVAAGLAARELASWSGARLALNFIDFEAGGAPAPFAPRRQLADWLPVTLPELEEALRAAAARDPTQPWHPFFLGQALWALERREEAETLWRRTWEGDLDAVPYYELFWMAAFHEAYGQPRWADRGYAVALEARRRLPVPIAGVQPLERAANTATFGSANLLRRDPERRGLWWRRVREIGGVATGDAFRAALWADHFARRGDRDRARAEAAFLAHARAGAGGRATAGAWLDYGLYLTVAVAATLFVRLTLLAGRLARGWRRRRSRPDARALLAGARRPGLELAAMLLALHLALSLTVLAASHIGYLASLPFEPGDVAAKPDLTGGDLLRAWLGPGIVEPAQGSPAPLVAKAQEIRGHGLGLRLLLAVTATAAALALAWPAVWLLGRGRVKRAVTRWLPGAAHARAGADLKGALLFGLFVFAALPLAWLVLARAWDAVPAPGLVSANIFLHVDLEQPFLPPPMAGDGVATGHDSVESLRAASFLSLLWVYPGARLFWALVLGALATSVSRQISQLRRRS